MIRVEKIIPGGQALGTNEDGKKIFFWNALPGEIVEEYEITKKKSHFEEAIALKILEPSKHRIEPKDECFLSTSPWQCFDYDYELKTKQELVVELFREHNVDIELPDIITDHREYYYRNKMEYSLYWDRELSKIFPSIHARGSHRKIPILSSSIERPEIFAEANKIIEDLNSRHEEARKYQTLLLRCNQEGEVSGGLYENGKPHPTFPHLTDTILGHTYSYSPNGFFQINLPVYELALKEIKPFVTTDEVLDLYAGVGTIGLSVARNHHLTLVEVDRFAYKELYKNCKGFLSSSSEAVRLGLAPWSAAEEELLKNPNALLAKSEEALEYINFNQTVILDPPRAGCDKKLIEKLNDVKPKNIIYLSCNPATQARDIKLLLENYQIASVKTFNFFPHTPHIENLVILQKSC